MNNKVLVIVYIPTIEKKYEVFIPIGKKVHTICKYLVKLIAELSNGELETGKLFALYSKETGLMYDYNAIIKESDIRNGNELILI